MNTKELIAMIQTAHDLGHTDITLMIDESRDGEVHYARARASLTTVGDQHDPETILIFNYE